MQVFRSLHNQYYTKQQILYMLIIPCDYNERPFCAMNLLMKWAKFIILHTALC